MAASKPEEWVAERIIGMIEQGNVVPWRKPWNSTEGLPKNLMSKSTYRGLNLWLLMMAPYARPLYVTPNQVNKLGGVIKKGERAWPVYFWSFKDNPKDPSKKFAFCKHYKAFNVSQCEGLDSKLPPQPELKDINKIDECEKIVQGYSGPEIVDGNKACYSPSADKVFIPNIGMFESAEYYYSTLFHELGHSSGHSNRLNRPIDNVFDNHAYSEEELVAEFTAAMLCAEVGISPAVIDNQAAYVATWLEKLKQKPEILIMAARAANKASDLILNKNFNNE